MPELDDEIKAILRGPNFAHIGTVNPDGTPQVNPVWVDVEGDRPVFNTVVGRQKERNLRRDPRVTLELLDPDNPYGYVEIRGTVELTEVGAEDQIDALSRKYTGRDYQWRKPGQRRIKVYVNPTKVHSSLG
jgi:PPOX class probable F420-dependent enzyme